MIRQPTHLCVDIFASSRGESAMEPEPEPINAFSPILFNQSPAERWLGVLGAVFAQFKKLAERSKFVELSKAYEKKYG